MDLLKVWDDVVAQIAALDRFSYEILSMMQRVSSDSIPTMGVTIKNSRLILMYNPEFVKTLDKREISAVIVHEVLHVALHHITRHATKSPEDAKRWNIAYDLAINCLIQDSAYRKLPDNCLFPGRGMFEKLQANQTAEWYYKQIKEDENLDQKCQQLGGEGEGQPDSGQFDDHSGWGADPLLDAEIQNRVEKIAQTNRWGNAWGQTAIDLIKDAQKSQIAWQRLLRHELGRLKSFFRKSDIRKPSRRLPRPYCGTRKRGIDDKLVAIDTSGSVFGTQIQKDFFREVMGLAKVQPVDIVFFGTHLETEVQRVTGAHSNYNPVGGGGTDFKCVWDLAKEKGYRSVVLLTDGFAQTHPDPGIKNLIVCLTPDGRWSAPYGRVVQLKE